jgi:hypothetical protein
MGFLDRIIDGVNAAARPAQDLGGELTRDRSLARADDLAAQGEVVYGTIVGIRRKLEDSTERHFYAVDVPFADGTRRFGIEVMGKVRSRLRLGLPVIVRTDGDKAVFDLAAMCAAWGIAASDGSQRAERSAPDPGIKDTALDMRVERHLNTWTRANATITGLERRTVLGVLTDNWDVHLQLADGVACTSPKDAVPHYAMWFAAPGTAVQAVVDPQQPERAAIDWPELAQRWASVPAVFEHAPTSGSVAAEFEAPPLPPAPMSFGGVQPVVPGSGATPEAPFHTAATNATIQGWIDTVKQGHMKLKNFHSALDDWEAAGMCTHAEAEAARRAVEQ